MYVADKTSHTHKCSRCGFEWSHGHECLGNVAAHTCRCGKESWWQHKHDARISDAHFPDCRTPGTLPPAAPLFEQTALFGEPHGNH
jgi:hypothetical protein